MKRGYTIRMIFRSILISCVSAGLILAVLAAGLRHWRASRYLRYATEAGQTHGVDPGLVMAVIRRESGLNPRAVGKVGEKGLMQLTEAAAREWAEATGVESFKMNDLFKPDINIHAGSWYLGRAIRYWSNKPDPLPYALAEYNAGRSNAIRWAEMDDDDPDKFRASITYPGTRRYIKDILDNYRGSPLE